MVGVIAIFFCSVHVSMSRLHLQNAGLNWTAPCFFTVVVFSLEASPDVILAALNVSTSRAVQKKLWEVAKHHGGEVHWMKRITEKKRGVFSLVWLVGITVNEPWYWYRWDCYDLYDVWYVWLYDMYICTYIHMYICTYSIILYIYNIYIP